MWLWKRVESERCFTPINKKIAMHVQSLTMEKFIKPDKVSCNLLLTISTCYFCIVAFYFCDKFMTLLRSSLLSRCEIQQFPFTGWALFTSSGENIISEQVHGYKFFCAFLYCDKSHKEWEIMHFHRFYVFGLHSHTCLN